MNSFPNFLQSVKGYICLMEKTFDWFDCIPKLFVFDYPIWSNLGKVVLFRLFVKILTDIVLLLKSKKFSRDDGFVYLFLSLDLFIIALRSAFVIKGASLPLTIFFFIGACLSRTILKIFVKTPYWWCFSLQIDPLLNFWSSS